MIRCCRICSARLVDTKILPPFKYRYDKIKSITTIGPLASMLGGSEGIIIISNL